MAESLVHKVPWLTRKIRKCMVIHNGLVLMDYASDKYRQTLREKLSVQNNEIVFGVFGRLSPEKGCLEILDAFNLLQNETDKAKLIYVGEGPMIEMMQKRIRHLNLEEKIIILGYCQQVQPLYEAIDVLVCPSRTEGLSNVILEAFANHKPVIATRVGGNPEIIKDQENGLLVNFGDIPGIKDRLLELVRKPELRLALGLAGYKTVRHRFDFMERMKAEEKIYLEVLGGGQAVSIRYGKS